MDQISQKELDQETSSHKKCSLRGWREAKTTMPQKPRGDNIFKSMQWMDPGIKSHSDQHVPMGLDTETRQASDKRPQKPEKVRMG